MKCHLIIWIILAVGSCWNNLSYKKYPHALLLKRTHYFILTVAKKQDWIKQQFQVRVWNQFKKLRVSQRFQWCWKPPSVLFFWHFWDRMFFTCTSLLSLENQLLPGSGHKLEANVWINPKQASCERIYQGSFSLRPPLPGHFIPISERRRYLPLTGARVESYTFLLLGWRFSLCSTNTGGVECTSKE